MLRFFHLSGATGPHREPSAQDLVRTLWSLNEGLDVKASVPHSYTWFLQRQWLYMVEHTDDQHTVTKSYEDIMPIVNRIKGGARYSELVSTILSHSPTTTGEVCEQSINLAARLLAMVEIGRSKSELFAERVLSWTEGTLQDFLSDHFGTLPVLKDDLVRLPKSFDAWSLQAVGGIDIGFTDNLADHLLLIEDDMKVLIYHHASFLKHQKNGVLPDGIAEETLNTLALLFPQSEFASPFRTKKRKRQWYQALRMGSTILVDEQLARCGNLRADSRQIERFKFWHDRLVVLKRAYDEATPRSISQWWYDRRNGVQWYTFWVAILVLMITTSLGVLQCVESALQVYKAYYPSGP